MSQTKVTEEEKQAHRDHLERKEKLLGQAYHNVFSTEEGEMVYEDLILKCGFYKVDTDKNANIYNTQGKREIALHIMRMREMDNPASFRKWLAGTFRRS
jgi:hypothetical protein